MTPANGSPSRSSAIEMAKCGMPCRKLVVPSSGSTIQRLDVSLPAIVAALFHKQPERRARLAQFRPQRLFGAPVGLADEVGGTLLRDLQVFQLAEVADQALRRFQSGVGHHVEEWRAELHGPEERSQSLARST